MNHQQAAHALALRHRLSTSQTNQLLALAAPAPSAQIVRLWFWRVVALLAAALGGLGIIMWVAANWETFGRFGRFALLQATVLVMGAGAAWKMRSSFVQSVSQGQPTASSTVWAMGLIGFLSIGALFAYFGQTYQTGADPWQLFALWAVLGLPICIALRSDTLWTPWVLVAAVGVALWLNAHTQHGWRVRQEYFLSYLMASVMGAVLVGVLSPFLRRWTGAGHWSFRAAILFFAWSVAAFGIAGLFSKDIAPQYVLAVALLLGSCAALMLPKLFDTFGLSIFSLGVIVLVMGGMVRGLFSSSGNDWVGMMFVLSLAAAGMLAVAVKLILSLQKKYAHSSDESAALAAGVKP